MGKTCRCKQPQARWPTKKSDNDCSTPDRTMQRMAFRMAKEHRCQFNASVLQGFTRFRECRRAQNSTQIDKDHLHLSETSNTLNTHSLLNFQLYQSWPYNFSIVPSSLSTPCSSWNWYHFRVKPYYSMMRSAFK